MSESLGSARFDIKGIEFPSYWVQYGGTIVTNVEMQSILQADGSTLNGLDYKGLLELMRDSDNSFVKCSANQSRKPLRDPNAVEKKMIKKVGKQEHHLWSKRDSTGSGQKALNLVRMVSGLPNEKEAVYGELDKWTAWEPEFPLIAAAKALQILKNRNQWIRVIQVAKWMLGKGQGMTMGTFDILLLAFDMDSRLDEAESFWNMILHTHTRSISKRLFSRMISLYDHHNLPDKIIEVFADMEELGVKPDEDTTRTVAHAFQKLGQEDNQKLVIKKYLGRWKYIHFKGERVRVRRDPWNE